MFEKSKRIYDKSRSLFIKNQYERLTQCAICNLHAPYSLILKSRGKRYGFCSVKHQKVFLENLRRMK